MRAIYDSMRIKKLHLNPPTSRELQAAAKELANATSLTVLRYLFHAGFGLQSSIINGTGIKQSALSKKLSALLSIGLVTKDCFRTCKIYSLNRDHFQMLGFDINVWLGEKNN